MWCRTRRIAPPHFYSWVSGPSPSWRRVVFHARLEKKSAQLKGLDSGPNVCRGLGNRSNVIPGPWQPGQCKEWALHPEWLALFEDFPRGTPKKKMLILLMRKCVYLLVWLFILLSRSQRAMLYLFLFFLGQRGKSSEWRVPPTACCTWAEDSVRLLLSKNSAGSFNSLWCQVHGISFVRPLPCCWLQLSLF